ncbi:MAG: hypothetical protein ACI3YD_07920 [Alloprevotella sp.]
MQHYDDIQQLVTRFMMAETTIEEERRLTEYFLHDTEIPAEWRTVAAMLIGAAARPSLKGQQKSRKRSRSLPRFSWGYVAAAVLVIALPIGWLWHRSPVSQPEIQDLAMQQPKVKSLSSQTVHTARHAEAAAQATSTSTLPPGAEPSRRKKVKHVTVQPVKKADATAQTARNESPNTQEVSEEAMQLVKQHLQEELHYQKLVEDILQNMTEQTSQNTYSI